MRSISTARNSIEVLSRVSKRRLGTPSLTLTPSSSANASRISDVASRRGADRAESLARNPSRSRWPAIGLQHLAAPAQKLPADRADGSDERDTSDQEVSSSPSHVTSVRPVA